MKIAIFHLAFIYSGGGEKLVLQQAAGLKKLGHEVEIFTSAINSQSCFPDYIKKFKIKTFLPQVDYLARNHESLVILLSCTLAPLFAIKFRNFDVILAANQPSPWMAFWVKKFLGVPYVSYLAQPTRVVHPRNIDRRTGLKFAKKTSRSLTMRLMERFRPFIKWADQISITSADATLANGEYIKGVLEKVYKITATSCPAGVDTRRGVQPANFRGKRPFLLITNRHYAQKRFEYGLFALSYLLHSYPDLRLVITGEETDYTFSLKALANQLALTDKVDFLGYVSENQLRKLYESAYVYLYTAPEEDFGMGIIEAMIAGTPVVAWANAGPTGIIKHNKTGLLAKPFDSTDFARCVKRLVSKKALYKKIVLAAAASVESEFSFSKHMKLLEATLEKSRRKMVLRNSKKI